ncbi:hypothetical protein F4055_05260 [Candidatus Poribacteria bacterium]|nr:hypothetical protein [Candidatus Poribacteria bacterium]
MAKKKGRRSANVARKREKRKRYQKSRQKQLAVEKQRRLRYEKSEEEHLHACIAQSRQLLHEPELEGVLFDPELMYTQVMELLSDYEVEGRDTPTNESVEVSPIFPRNALDTEMAIMEQPASTSDAETACENFRLEVLPHLVTPEFMRNLRQALTACETRLKLTGNRNLAEVAYVTRSLFEAAPPEILAFHPMIQAIGIETLRVLVEEQDLIIEWRDGVKEILSDVLEHEDLEASSPQQTSVFSDTPIDHKRQKGNDTETTPPALDAMDVETETYIEYAAPNRDEPEVNATIEAALDPAPVESLETLMLEAAPQPLSFSPDELPARALYKNFTGLAIKENFKEQTDKVASQNGLLNYALVSESEEQIEFIDIENERYVKITEERLQLHARSDTELRIAMTEIEAQCSSVLMYLAKTIEERG